MDRAANVIKYYLYANKLKNKLRSGWLDIGISADRIESVAEHTYGCLVLTLAIDSEYKLDLDLFKVLKMLILHETEEILMKDFTIRDNITDEEKIELGRKMVNTVTDGLLKKDEIISLLEEFNEGKTKEAAFSYHIDKIECDFQAKIYDLKGNMDINRVRGDLNYYGVSAEEIDKNAKHASDYWLDFHKERFDGDELFLSILDEIKKIDSLNN